MAIIYKDISGTSTSEVSAKLRYNDLLSSDLFLVSQQALTSTDPSRTYQWHGQTLNNFYASRKLSYNVLSSQVFSDLCNDFGIKSMAWESSADYSLYNHVHNYSTISVETFVRPSEDKAATSAIVTIRDGRKRTTVYMPEVKCYKQPEPYIGQLKFTTSREFKYIDCNSPNFDGWVYPDGREVSQSRFAKAHEFFGDSYGEASNGMFKLPCLTSFMKLITPTSTGNWQTLDLSSQRDEHEVLKSHSHRLDDLQIRGKIEQLSVVFENVDNTKNGYYCHGVKKSSSKAKHNYDIWFTGSNVRLDEGQKTMSTEIQKTTHPTYNYLPVLMYIGVK